MRICGLQKLTLLDYPDHIACTIFTSGCNFMCPFCQNSSLVLNIDRNVEIPEDEVLDFLKKRVGILEGVCITGGEPTLQRDLEDFIKKVKELGFKVKLDTNGYKPEILKKLVNEKLIDFVSMDIKNSPEKYPLTAGIDKINMDLIKNSVDFLISNGVDYEFRTTVVKEFHERGDFVEIAKFIKGAKRYYLQQFRDSESCIQQNLHAWGKDELIKFIEILAENGVKAELRGIEWGEKDYV